MSLASGRLIYVEDDEVLSRVTTRSLTRRGFEVHHYASLHAVNERPGELAYSHALLDLRLEDGSTLNLIREFCENYNGIRVVVLTGYASIATAVQAVKWGAVNYLAKPATTEQIVRAFDEQPAAAATQLKTPDEASDGLSLKRLEWEHIQQTLAANGGNIAATARQLKMHRRTLQRKLHKRPASS